MTDLTTKIKNLELDTLSNLRTSKSKNTIRAYNSDFSDFKSFCAIQKWSRILGTSFDCYEKHAKKKIKEMELFDVRFED